MVNTQSRNNTIAFGNKSEYVSTGQAADRSNMSPQIGDPYEQYDSLHSKLQEAIKQKDDLTKEYARLKD